MLYPPTNSSILVFSTFAHLPPTNYLACSFLILIFYYNRSEKPKNIILNPHSCASFSSPDFPFIHIRAIRSIRVEIISLVLCASFFSPLKFMVTKKGVLLACKCNPFACQKDSFCSPKGLLLQRKRAPFADCPFYVVKIVPSKLVCCIT